MDNTAEVIDNDAFEVEDELNLDEQAETETEELEEQAGDDLEESSTDEEEAGETDEGVDDDEEVVVSIDGESPPPEEEGDTGWIKNLRKKFHTLKKEKRELEAKLKAQEEVETKPTELGPKPTLEGSSYDTDKYEADLAEWYENKREHDLAKAEVEKEQARQAQAWQDTLDDYGKKREALKVRDYDEAEAAVQETFSEAQQAMIVQGADNPAVVFYALGKNPSRLKELSSIKDPVKFAFTVAKLEAKMKVSNRKASTKPEKTVSASGRSSGAMDNTLERLEAEAEKTGDRSKVVAYKRKQKAKNR